jgi:hypothetical protein
VVEHLGRAFGEDAVTLRVGVGAEAEEDFAGIALLASSKIRDPHERFNNCNSASPEGEALLEETGTDLVSALREEKLDVRRAKTPVSIPTGSSACHPHHGQRLTCDSLSPLSAPQTTPGSFACGRPISAELGKSTATLKFTNLLL